MKKTLSIWCIVIGVLLCVSQVAMVSAEEGLVAYWDFNEGNGETARDSVTGIDDVIVNPIWTEGIEGSALDFMCAETIFDDEKTIEVSRALSDAPKLEDGTFTFSVWVKLSDETTRWKGFLDFQNYAAAPDARGFNYGTGSGNIVDMYLSAGGEWQGIMADKPLEVGKWYNVVATYDFAYNLRLYINGELAKEATLSGPLMTIEEDSVDYDMKIGSLSTHEYGTIPGILDEVKIYNRALSADEIKTAYEALAK